MGGMTSDSDAEEFVQWSGQWLGPGIGGHTGRQVDEVEARIARLLALWDAPIPGDWQRPGDQRVRGGARYTRGNASAAEKRRGEHAIEYEILRSLESPPVDCLGYQIIDGVNAVALARDEHGGRGGNVEADLLILGECRDQQRVFVVEVKVGSNNAWYAAVELLRQMRLYSEATGPRDIFKDRGVLSGDHPPVSGLVLAPTSFYEAAGQKSASVAPASALLRAVADHAGIDAHLAVWDPAERRITQLAVQEASSA